MFEHLHIHNEYSLLDGFGKAEQYVKRGKKLGFNYLALTNHGNIDGLIKWQKACIKHEIEPVLGVEAYIINDHEVKEKGEKRGHIVLLIKNKKGFRNICTILSQANKRGFYHRPRIDPKMLLRHLDGLVVMTACISGFIQQDWGLKLFEKLAKKIPKDLFIEIMPHVDADQRKANKRCLLLSEKYKIPLVATNDCHYVTKSQWKAQEVLLAINRKALWSNENRFKFPFIGLHLRTVEEMQETFEEQGQLPQMVYRKALMRTGDVAKRCAGFRIEKREVRLPKIKTKMRHDKLLFKLCDKALKSMDLKERMRPVYRLRLTKEFKLVKKKKFESYFILVYRLLQHCRENDIGYGLAGRGSVGCSLLAYLLGITNVDPVKYGLPMDRFISEDRIDYPDIDMDFEDTKTDLVRSYLEEEFGEDKVFGVSTFSKMKGRGVIRDVARVFEVPLEEVDEFAKSIESIEKQDKGADNAVKIASTATSIGEEFNKRYPEVVKIARQLEGQVRHGSQHASAVVVAVGDPASSSVMVKRSNVIMCNWDMVDAEYMGLVKLDILKLDTVTILCETLKSVEKSRGVVVDLRSFSFDDPKVFEEIAKGNVKGCFQVRGWATRQVAMDIEVENFRQLSDAIALSRPGPKDSGMTDEYIRRRHGDKWKRKHIQFEKETKNTYGVVVYQEQVMGILRSVGGFTYSDADKVRKVIGKKRSKKEFEPFRQQFIRGALDKRTFDSKEAEEFWRGLESHARYSFNAAHSLSYAMIAYWDMYLKVNYPIEFICASLAYGSKDKDKKRELIDEVQRMGLDILPPKVGISDGHKWVVKDQQMFMPFIEIEGIGEKSLDKIGVMKEDAQMGLWAEEEAKPVSKRIQQILVDIGAYDVGIPDKITDYITYDVFGTVPKVQSKRWKINRKQLKCKRCGLHRECTLPVQPQPGKYNVMIAGDAPGYVEDKEGKSFVGKPGEVLWKKLGGFGLKRIYFHVTDAVKCHPSISKKPDHEEVSMCYRHWLVEEIEGIECSIILALGNKIREALTGKTMGIRGVSGESELVRFAHGNVKVCWGMHPSAIFRGDELNTEAFEKGVNNFIEELRRCHGTFDEILF